jgi:hypothetical protein
MIDSAYGVIGAVHFHVLRPVAIGVVHGKVTGKSMSREEDQDAGALPFYIYQRTWKEAKNRCTTYK